MKTEYFTASQIAKALGVSRQAAHKVLQSVPADDVRPGNGGESKRWRIVSLPQDYQNKLHTLATQWHYRSAEDFIAKLPNQWQCPVAFGELSKEVTDAAYKLQAALAKPLEQQHKISRTALTELGLDEYQKQFDGYRPSPRKWNELFDRTVQRAGAVERPNWTDPRIYLDESAFKPAPKISDGNGARVMIYQHEELQAEFNQITNKTKPTVDDKAHLWVAVFRRYEALLAVPGNESDERGIRSSLVEYVHAAIPALSDSREGIFKQFSRGYKRWVAGGRTVRSVEDKRHMSSGKFTKPVLPEDAEKLIAEAVKHNGNLSMAHRKLRLAGELSEDFTGRFSYNIRKNKSQVARSIREELKPRIDSMLTLHRGPQQARMAGAFIERNWDDVLPGEWFSGDDVTWNSYFYYQDEVTGEYVITRGECLVMTDLKTDYPLDFMLIAGKYNSRHIRSLLLRVHDVHGLPDKGVLFERGIWAARLIDGDKLHRTANLPWRETENGLRETGVDLDVRHAKGRNPRTKPIEGAFRIVQERMRSERGFVGFNERLEKMEFMQDFLNRVRRGKEHPANELFSMEEWATRIAIQLEEFAGEPQNGKRNPGISPAEHWEARIRNTPLRKLPDDARFLLGTHKKPVRVTERGVAITINGKTYRYAGSSITEHVNRDMLAFFNIDMPELLTVSNPGRTQFFSLRAMELPAMAATRTELNEAKNAINGMASGAKLLYGKLKHQIVSTVTHDNRYADEVKDLGRFHNEQQAAAVREFNESKAAARKVRQRAESMGVTVEVNEQNAARKADALSALEQALRAADAAENERGSNDE